MPEHHRDRARREAVGEDHEGRAIGHDGGHLHHEVLVQEAGVEARPDSRLAGRSDQRSGRRGREVDALSAAAHRLHRRQAALRCRIIRHAEQHDEARDSCCKPLHWFPLFAPPAPPRAGVACSCCVDPRWRSVSDSLLAPALTSFYRHSIVICPRPLEYFSGNLMLDIWWPLSWCTFSEWAARR